jgi:hypothetical protein
VSGGLQTFAQFSFLFTALVTVFGWYYVAKQADRREFRKETREHVKALQERGQKVLQSATDYWLSSKVTIAGPAAVALKADVLSLARQVRTINAVGFEIDSSLTAAIRTAATGGDFEKKGRRTSAKDSDRLVDVANAIEDLMLAVDEAFYARFPPMQERRGLKWLPFIGVGLLSSDQST